MSTSYVMCEGEGEAHVVVEKGESDSVCSTILPHSEKCISTSHCTLGLPSVQSLLLADLVSLCIVTTNMQIWYNVTIYGTLKSQKC